MSGPEAPPIAMSSILADDVRRELLPLVERIQQELEGGDPRALEFFARIQQHLVQASSEEHLADAFMDLSTAAFVLEGVDWPPMALLLVDTLLARAQDVAATLSAGTTTPQ